LYIDYDGQGSHFGDVSLQAVTSDVVNMPVYAALNRAQPNQLHVILINRNLTSSQTAAVTIAGSSSYQSGHAFGFDGSGSVLTDRGTVTVTNNAFSMDLGPLSATHVVLMTDSPPDVTVTPPATGGAGNGANDGSPKSGDGKSEGCGCRVPARSPSGNSMLPLLAALIAISSRRRR